MARPRKVIDPKHVEALARIACTNDEMATVLGCSADTLERRFAAAINAGRNHGRVSLRRMQFQLALNGDKTMLIWLGKQYLGQRERIEKELSSADLEGLARITGAMDAVTIPGGASPAP